MSTMSITMTVGTNVSVVEVLEFHLLRSSRVWSGRRCRAENHSCPDAEGVGGVVVCWITGVGDGGFQQQLEPVPGGRVACICDEQRLVRRGLLESVCR